MSNEYRIIQWMNTREDGEPEPNIMVIGWWPVSGYDFCMWSEEHLQFLLPKEKFDLCDEDPEYWAYLEGPR